FPLAGLPNDFPNGIQQITDYLATGALGATPAISYNNFKTPKVIQYNFGIQQGIGDASVVSVGFAGSRGINQSSFSDYNSPLAVFDGPSLAYPAGAKRFNPKFDAINYTASNSNSWYNAATATFLRRLTSGLQTQVSYTFSKTESISETAQLAEYSGS